MKNKIVDALLNIKYLFSTANKADKLLMPIMFLSIFMECAVLFINTILPKYIIDSLTIDKNIHYTLRTVIIMVIVRLLSTAIFTLLEDITRYKKERLIQQHYKQFSDKTMSLDLQDVEDPIVADQKENVQKIITWNSMNIDGIKNALGGILSYSIQIVGFAYIISTLNFFIVLSVIVVLLVNAQLNHLNHKLMKKVNDELNPINRTWKYLSRITGDYSFGKIIRIDNLNKWLLGKCEKNRSEYIEKETAKKNTSTKYGMISSTVSLIQEGAVYIYLVLILVKGGITFGDFTMYISAVMALTNAMKSIVGYLQGIDYTGRYVIDYRKFLSIPERITVTNGESVPDISKNNLHIRFDNVSFRYPNCENFILKNINLDIYGDKKISIVGDNGAGKTTFIKLLLRLYDPTEGNIYINGINIKNINTADYVALFSTVFQDYQMFPFTIAENIAFKDEVLLEPEEKQRLKKALADVNMWNKVSALKNKEHTYIGKSFDMDGLDFSGGELQKFALARSFYHSGEINILDEPTANLSPIAEFETYSSYDKLVNDMAIYISHRMSSSKFCDRILVFDGGCIVEDGTHNQLTKSNGLYAKMYSMQARYYFDSDKVNENEVY